MKTKNLHLLLVLTLFASLHRSAAKPGDKPTESITYQGRLLTAAGAPANGSYDITFTLFNTVSNGSPVAGPFTNTAVSVSSNGLFTTLMDFGPSPFNGSTTNWVEIGVQTNGGSGFTTLTPRQLLTPAPLSLYASTAGVANGVSATTVIQGQSLSIGQSNTVGGAYSTIAGGGNNAATMDYAVVAGGYGNTASSTSDTVAGGSVNTANGPNAAVGGGTGNMATGQNSVVAGGSFNTANGTNATVVGGDNNTALDYDFIGGGQSNVIGNAWSVIAGGLFNHVHEVPFNYFQSIGGGFFNSTWATEATIGGGFQNNILSGATEGTISGGSLNTIQTSSPDSTVGGGYGNLIQNNASYAMIGGGDANTIKTFASDSTIGGGYQNTVGGGLGTNTTTFNTLYATVSGGSLNTASNYNSTVSGGGNNVAGAQFATVGGGGTNFASGAYATISGGEGNAASGGAVFVGGGIGNTASSGGDVSVGGVSNSVSGGLGFIGGGSFNSVSANHSGIGSGATNAIQTGAGSSFIGGGDLNLIQSSANESVIGGGTSNTIQNFAVASTIGGGFDNFIGGGLFYNTNTGVVSGTNISYATIGGGLGNLATNAYTTIPGGQQAVAANYAQQAYSSGSFQSAGDSQYSLYVLRGATTTNCVTCNSQNLYLDGQSLEIALPANRSMAFNMNVVARTAGVGGLASVFSIVGGANGATANYSSTITLNQLGFTPANVVIAVNSGFLEVQITGIAGTNIRWTATVQAAEESY
jgi:hypothetical protein